MATKVTKDMIIDDIINIDQKSGDDPDAERYALCRMPCIQRRVFGRGMLCAWAGSE